MLSQWESSSGLGSASGTLKGRQRDRSADTNDTSDADFISAKSKPTSPADESPPEMILPTMGATAVQQDKLGAHALGKKFEAEAEAELEDGKDEKVPTQDDYDTAVKLFHREEEMAHVDVAPWLGEDGTERARVRTAYMEMFDWKNMSVLAALRAFCNHVALKGETQQQDRLLVSISERWCACNPHHGFKHIGE